ncbi:MAG: ferrochelatase [Sorangiineae bacterium]|nr:ferrochelatase [Sorangiineae bacterium]
MTAHSLPSAAIRAGDRYEAEVRASAAAVGALVDRPFRLAFQSQGADGGEWLGPGLRDALEAARAAGARRAVVAPIGFLADHVETLYDLDVEARDWARALGLELARVPALGAHPGLVEALARVAERTLAGR